MGRISFHIGGYRALGADQRKSLSVIHPEPLRSPRRPSVNSLRSWIQEFCLICGAVKDEVMTVNEPWFGSAAIE